MIRAVTFTPSSGAAGDLTYFERASRDRSLHVLLQDSSTGKIPSRQRFLHNAYREVISRYVGFGRIEHSLPIARGLILYLEQLSRRVDCRVDDFRGVGFYVLFQDGATFYLLASREGRVKLRLDTEFVTLSERPVPGVKELPVDTVGAQKELFSQDLKDFLAFYRIDLPAGKTLEIAMGGRSEEMDTVMEAIDQPGIIDAAGENTVIPVNSISRKLVFLRFEGLARRRDLIAAPVRKGPRPIRRGVVRGAAVAASLVLVVLVVVWMGRNIADLASLPRQETAATIGEGTEGGPVVSAAREVPAAPAGNSEATDTTSMRVGFSLAWEKTYGRPVTSSPRVADGRVVFGCRDGSLYSLDAGTGETQWRYRAAAGIGASPWVAGDRVLGADYLGNVFALNAKTGERVWNRRLPQKVSSSPCAGEGEVLVGCFNGTAYALSIETGRVLWKTVTGQRVWGSPCYARDRFFVPSYDGKLYAITAGTGAVHWTYQVGGNVSSSPAADSLCVVVGAPDGTIRAVGIDDGREVWRAETGAAVKSFVEQHGGRVYAGSNDGALYCLDAGDGGLVWKFPTRGPVMSRAAVIENWVVMTSYDGRVYMIDAESGREVDRFRTAGAVFSSPAVNGNRVYFGNNEGKFYCLNYRERRTS